MLCVSGISLPLDADEAEALAKARRKARLSGARAREVYVYRCSVDARRRGEIRLVYTVAIRMETAEEEERHAARLRDPAVRVCHETQPEIRFGTAALPGRPVVAGFGPAGMFCALMLARGGYRPLVLERGGDTGERIRAVERFWNGGPLDPENNVQFGEGGAGTFSDGKLTTRVGDPLCAWVIRELIRFGAPAEIARLARPHVGTDRLRGVVRSLREEIAALGGEVRFHTPLTGLDLRGGRLAGVQTRNGPVGAGVLVAAIGHSARDSFRMLLEQGARMQPKPFSVGMRVEHLRQSVERALYGGLAGHPRLPAAEYQLSWRENGRGVYTFCMCPGGVVTPAASSPGMLVVNGMSEYARDGENSNSALVCGVGPEDFGPGPLDGVAFQERLERAAFNLGGGDFRAPVQTAGRFLAGEPGAAFGQVRPTYAAGVREADFSALFPGEICRMLREGLTRFGARQPGFDSPDAVLTGVESRTSSPVRIERGETLESNIAGLFPCGEGAGYAGGIVSAAVDGVRVAREIMSRYRPLD